MNRPPLPRDARPVPMENNGYCWAYLFLAYGLLVLVAVAYRAFAQGEQVPVLLALGVFSGVFTAFSPGGRSGDGRPWVTPAVVAVAFALTLASVLLALG